ncbi:Carboxysome shell and ethanolamine utilization microcompartment protein CcmL/EutN [Anaerovirgula multivorans]|uniref:Carboxysome shell and ethanolamine utilization microcompartment protein CcmL/EutN n=1 Tax=Anaerovirgula multivorans TaxID=312168 RepID=A0A239FTL7_9FIRM|nr:BMC domain-containing protein [Anaerovirgula multivorans]SNS60486.1 Carboxysome shell and ethanolamine utilization microcompartment protein CcmL/EutN [Anaerovirgula multivorans]
MRAALGLIEAIGLTTAITALDAAGKAADVKLVGYEKVIGAGKAVSVTVHIAGEVAAVKASVEAGVAAASKVGTVLSHHVIPRPHEEVDLIIKAFEKNLQKKAVREQLKESEGVEENNSEDKKKEE